MTARHYIRYMCDGCNTSSTRLNYMPPPVCDKCGAVQTMVDELGHLISPTMVAEELQIPLLSVGQAVLDKRLHVCEGFTFKLAEVLALKADLDYIATLR